MSAANSVSSKIIDHSQSHDSKWDDAIRDAEIEIESLTKQTRRLEDAVRTFKANKKDGVPWPGSVAEQQKSPQEGGQ